MPNARHAPARLRSYLNTHEARMDAYLSQGFVHEHNLAYEAVADHLIISGQIACLGDIIRRATMSGLESQRARSALPAQISTPRR